MKNSWSKFRSYFWLCSINLSFVILSFLIKVFLKLFRDFKSIVFYILTKNSISVLENKISLGTTNLIKKNLHYGGAGLLEFLIYSKEYSGILLDGEG